MGRFFETVYMYFIINRVFLRLHIVHDFDFSCVLAADSTSDAMSCQSSISHRHTDLLVLLLWSPYVIGQTIIFSSCFFLLSSSFFSSPNLSGRRLDVYHTLAHGVALVRI